MNLEIVSRTGTIFHGDVKEVVVPAAQGQLGILPGHTPLLAILVPGTVHFVQEDGAAHTFNTARGFVTMENDQVMVVVDAGIEAEQVKSV
ncbi:MAG: ATP synthase F1 subunit epsilon [Actinomycetaceae bacterium]|nr:ATP synthase F1 subunit epsilon [Arcanobacterium sp.]MDD7687481.1 ATP synthase F1 subunit epsilon [Actinomycetaceae bacterium]MDY5272956.1 ATP synthase F1 subunit epsilon [Arcanobacterium sp.]